MCCRYYILPKGVEWDPIREAAESARVMRRFRAAGIPLVSAGEVRPCDTVPALASDRQGGQQIFPMRWGFSLRDRAPLINARVETAAEKPSFREAWAAHRCAAPASWDFEWKHETGADGRLRKTRFAVRPGDGSLTWLCGLYRIENGFPVFVVLTKQPTVELSKIHDRMPLMLSGDKIAEWIDPSSDPADLLSCALSDMIIEKTEE
jgi:putative SOS response-associated peptidase YedK